MKSKKIPDALKSGHEIMKEEAEKLGLEILDYYPDSRLPALRRRKKAASPRRTTMAASRNGRSRRKR